MGMVFKSGIFATLGAALGAADTTITLTSGHESRFNTWLATQYDYTWLTVVKISDPLKPYERIKVKGPLTGTSIPVVARGQDGTSALSFNSGERIELRLCAPMLERFVEAEDSQTLADVLAVSVGGTVNVITATHTYPLSDLVGSGNAPTNGMTSVFVPSGRNSSASVTYSPDGLTAKAIVLPGNKTLPEGALRPSMKALVVYDSAIGAWILQNAASVPFEPLSGTITGATTLDRSHHGKTIQANGTFTLGITAAATLGADWWCVLQVQDGAVTIDPNGSEAMTLPDQTVKTTLVMSRGAVMLVCDGAGFAAWPINGTTNVTVYTSSGTHRFNPMTKRVMAIAIGGGGASGSSGSSSGGGGGGGSGGYNVAITSSFSSKETVTVGAGGATLSAAGGTSSLGAIVSATGGSGGATADGGGGGGAGGSPNGTAGESGLSSSPYSGGNGAACANALWVTSKGGSGAKGSAATAGTGYGAGGGGGAIFHGGNTWTAGAGGAVIVVEMI